MAKKRFWRAFGTLLGLLITFLVAWGLLVACQNYLCQSYDSLYIQYLGMLSRFMPKLILVAGIFLLFKITSLFVFGLIFRKVFSRIYDEAKSTSIIKLVRFGLWTAFVLITLYILIGNLGAILTSLGLIGFGLTFALQKPITNFVGWLTIIVKNVYREGDRIEVGTIRGDVKEIQLMNTVLYGLLENAQVRDYRTVTFPNELVLTSEVNNLSIDSNYIREEFKISITYESDYKKAIKLVEKITSDLIKENSEKYKKASMRKISFLGFQKLKRGIKFNQAKVDAKPETKEIVLEDEFIPTIRTALADSSIDLIIRCLIPYEMLNYFRSTINIRFLDAIAKDKSIEVAYPHMEIVYKK